MRVHAESSCAWTTKRHFLHHHEPSPCYDLYTRAHDSGAVIAPKEFGDEDTNHPGIVADGDDPGSLSTEQFTGGRCPRFEPFTLLL
jgi:hypothetical protein